MHIKNRTNDSYQRSLDTYRIDKNSFSALWRSQPQTPYSAKWNTPCPLLSPLSSAPRRYASPVNWLKPLPNLKS